MLTPILAQLDLFEIFGEVAKRDRDVITIGAVIFVSILLGMALWQIIKQWRATQSVLEKNQEVLTDTQVALRDSRDLNYDLKEQMLEASKRIFKLENANDDLQEVAQARHDKIVELETYLKNDQKTISELTKKSNEQNDKIITLQNVVGRLQDELNREKTNSANERTENERKISALQDRIDELVAENVQLKREREELKQEREELHKSLDSAETRLSDQDSRLQQNDRDLMTLRKQVEELEKRLDTGNLKSA